MERHGRRLLAFSFVAFLGVLTFGSIRAMGPLKAVLDTSPEATRSLSAFHSHFDQLCWLGSAALGAAFLFLGRSYRGRPEPVGWFTTGWMVGSLVFASSFLARGVGQARGIPALAKGGFALLVSAGGTVFLVLIALGVYIALGLRAPAGAPPQDEDEPAAAEPG